MIFVQSALMHLQTTKFFPPFKGATRRRGFFPSKDPSKLHNCKQYFWVHRDGILIQAVYLNALEKSFREEIILRHYILHMVKVFRKDSIGFNILTRDQPWDFRVGFSSGVTVNVEITSISDRIGFFEKLGAEELIQRHSYYPQIRLGILRKISMMFPNQSLNNLICDLKAQGNSNSDEVSNPFYKEAPKLFLSTSIEPTLDITNELRNAIFDKQLKKHDGKKETILIIDNRTSTADIYDFIRVAHKLHHFLNCVDFQEVWLFTGYGGGHKQPFEESLLLPLKLPSSLSDCGTV